LLRSCFKKQQIGLSPRKSFWGVSLHTKVVPGCENAWNFLFMPPVSPVNYVLDTEVILPFTSFHITLLAGAGIYSVVLRKRGLVTKQASLFRRC
jgi:hypothetical protein